jgi:glycosyltransferase involved in cell wall biosynthesis
VVPLLNDAETVADQLAALLAQDYTGAWELVVVDNGSDDDSFEMAERCLDGAPNALVVRATDRRSAGHARNVGASRASGDFLAFTDADDVVYPGWLTAMVEAAPQTDVVAGAVEVDALNDECTRAWHGTSPSLSGFSLGLSGASLGLSGLSSTRQHALPFLTYACGTNTGVWADVFERLGGFDEDTIAGEDVEFSWRAQLAGHDVAPAPAAVVRQRLRTRVASLARQQYLYGTAGPNLYRRYRGSGMPRSNPRETLGTWAWIAGAWPAAMWSKRVRGRWALETAFACGRIAGSLRNRVLFV